jgi:hypothetical protein
MAARLQPLLQKPSTVPRHRTGAPRRNDHRYGRDTVAHVRNAHEAVALHMHLAKGSQTVDARVVSDERNPAWEAREACEAGAA